MPVVAMLAAQVTAAAAVRQVQLAQDAGSQCPQARSGIAHDTYTSLSSQMI